MYTKIYLRPCLLGGGGGAFRRRKRGKDGIAKGKEWKWKGREGKHLRNKFMVILMAMALI